jgi:23S rRNA (cytidine1920-2'-O)/16S rRNA (cytidine1409-2'-O)-methyltransferase
MSRTKIRIDNLLVERGIAESRQRAQAMILAGLVLVGDRVIDKAGTSVNQDVDIRIKGDANPFVSRGGLKLLGALESFSLSVRDLVALDVGASTGGFTDCLLQAGAKKVYAIDVGYGQLAWKIRNDPRVVNIERTNIRFFDGSGMDNDIDIAVIDVSFISLRLVMPPVIKIIKDNGLILSLVKPQFEAGRKEVGKQGVIKDPLVHERVLEEIETFCRESGLAVMGKCDSPLRGPAGNREFFLYLKKLSAPTGHKEGSAQWV